MNNCRQMLQELDRKFGLPRFLNALTFRPAWLVASSAAARSRFALAPHAADPLASNPNSAAPADDPLQLLRDCAGTLEPFIHESETALAAIGAVMADLFEGADLIRGDAQSFRDSIATMAESSNSKLLEIAASLRNSIAQLTESRALIQMLDRRLATVITDFAGLEAGVREFRVLGTLIRIEGTTRAADSDDFVTISEQAGGIATNLGELVQQIRDATAELRVSFRTVSLELNRLTTISQKTIVALLDDVTALEAAIAAEHRSVGAAADGTMLGLERIRNSIGELVCALQIHDILRQQSEHTISSLSELDQTRDLADPGFHACRSVVRAQMKNTLALCDQAAQSVEAGLDSAGQQLERIATIVHDVAGLTRLDSPSRQALRSSTGAILAALPVVEQGDIALQKALADLLHGSTAILDVVDKVSLAMLNMRWLGLNATIQSANRPQSGSAIETLGDRTAALAGNVDGECGHIRHALDQLRQDVNEYSQATVGSLGQQGIRQVIENSAALFDQVHRTMHAKVERQGSLQQTLRQKLDGAQSALSQFRDTQAAPAHAAARLPASPGLSGALSPAATELLHSWFARYTMASERRVHSECLGLPFAEVELDADAECDIELF